MGIRQPIDDHIKFNVYNMFVKEHIMLTILKPILLAFIKSNAMKKLIIQLLEALAKQSSNSLDDQAVEFIKSRLYPASNTKLQ